MGQSFVIYGLFDPRDGQLRYVGQSARGLARPREHARPSSIAKAPRSHKNRWLAKLSREGVAVGVKVLEECQSREELNAAEIRQIAKARAEGCDLVNATTGGETGPGITSEGHRLKIAATLRGRKHSTEHIAKIRQARGCKSFIDESGTVYSSQHEASRLLGVPQGRVSDVLAGRRLSASGHTFKYLE